MDPLIRVHRKNFDELLQILCLCESSLKHLEPSAERLFLTFCELYLRTRHFIHEHYCCLGHHRYLLESQVYKEAVTLLMFLGSESRKGKVQEVLRPLYELYSLSNSTGFRPCCSAFRD